MKKLFLTSFTVFLFLGTAVAQIDQGTIYVGGSANVNYRSEDIDVIDDNANFLNIGVAGGYFVGDDFLLGASFGYNGIGLGGIDDSQTSLGAFFRYYFSTPVFVGLGYDRVDPIAGDNQSFIPLEVGYAAFITETVALEPSVSYALGVGDTDINALEINIGFGLYFR